MKTQKIAGHVLFAIGIIGGVEGAVMRSELGRDMAIITSVIALIVIIIGAYLMEK
ncbi:MAG: hypothetical protein OIN88_01710 [Candidatus Methanoperedens sp.]|nr:hypothetical protein [Candidatus Methanoperedens sp.]MCZ7360444.1 hypothetical protein [Candidatus Methanoperedens sp.]